MTFDNTTTGEVSANVEWALVIISDKEQVSKDDAEPYQATLRAESQTVDEKDPTMVYDHMGTDVVHSEAIGSKINPSLGSVYELEIRAI